MASGVAQGIWQGLPLAHVAHAFHAGRALRFVHHHVLANHCGFTLMLYHESLRDHAKALIAIKADICRAWKAKHCGAPTPPTLLAGFGSGK